MVARVENDEPHSLRRRNVEVLGFLGVILLYFTAASLWLWGPSHYVMGATGYMGEAFEAFHGALNVINYGWRWAGLQDMATNPSPESHPFLYIHHANLGLYVSYVLYKVGITSIESQQLLSVSFSLIGLATAFGTLYIITRSPAISLLGIILLSINYNYISLWSFNIHRGLTYLCFFGVIFSYLRVDESKNRSIWILLFAIGMLGLLCADYIFFFYMLFFLVIFGLLTGARSKKAALMSFIIVLFSAGLVFSLRQIQVALGAGWTIWSHDFLYQVLNRIHAENLFSGNWSKTTTDFYADQFVLNPGFAPYSTWASRGTSFATAIGKYVLVSILGLQTSLPELWLVLGSVFVIYLFEIVALGLLAQRFSRPSIRYAYRMSSMLAIGAFAIGAVVVAICNWLPSGVFAAGLSGAAVIVLSGLAVFVCFWRTPLVDSVGPQTKFLSFTVASLFACGCMYALFPTYFLLWFPSFLLAPMCCAMWALSLFVPAIEAYAVDGRTRKSVVLAGCIIAIVSINAIPDFKANHVDQGDHAPALRALAGHEVVSNYTPASISSYTKSFSAWLKDDKVPTLLQTGTVAIEDYFMFFERNKMTNTDFLHPEYFFLFKSAAAPGRLEELKKIGSLVDEGRSYAIFKVPTVLRQP